MATATTPAALAETQRRLELRALLQKKYKSIDGKWDLVFWVTAIFVVAGAADITKNRSRATGTFGPTGRILSGGP